MDGIGIATSVKRITLEHSPSSYQVSTLHCLLWNQWKVLIPRFLSILFPSDKADGSPAIPHATKVKIAIVTASGEKVRGLTLSFFNSFSLIHSVGFSRF